MSNKWNYDPDSALKGVASGRLKPDTGRTTAQIAAALEADDKARKEIECKGCNTVFKPGRQGAEYCRQCYLNWKEEQKQRAYRRKMSIGK